MPRQHDDYSTCIWYLIHNILSARLERSMWNIIRLNSIGQSQGPNKEKHHKTKLEAANFVENNMLNKVND